MVAIFPTTEPNITLRVLPKIPATLQGAGGIAVNKTGGMWTIGPHWQDIALVAPGDLTTKEIWIRDTTTDTYARMRLSDVAGGGGGVSSPIMLPSGGAINWNSGDIVLTHSSDTLTMTGGTLALNPPANSLLKAINITQSLAGTSSGFNQANLINITSDTVNNGDWNELSGFAVIHNVGGSTATGHRAAIHGHLNMTAAGNPVGTGKDMSGGTFQVVSNNGNNTGGFIALSAIGYLTTGATGAGTLNGIEVNVGMMAGTTSASKFGVISALTFDNAANATGNEAAFAVYNNGAAANAWKTGLLFLGIQPVNSLGALITCDGNAGTFAHGINFSTYTFTSTIMDFGASIFRVTGAGVLFSTGLRQPSGGVIDWGAGDVTLTHSSKALTTNGALVVGTAPLAVNATDGFLYIPSSNGRPTGVPTARTGTVPIQFDTVNRRLWAYSGGWTGSREVLTADRTYYVRTDGNDTNNNGLTNTSGGAFATIARAYQVALTLDLAGFNVIIKLGNTGTFAGATMPSPMMGGLLIIEGDTTTPSNTVIHSASSNTIQWTASGALIVRYVKVTSFSSGVGIAAAGPGADITIGPAVEFGACGYMLFRAYSGGHIGIFGSTITISGGGNNAFEAATGGQIEMATATFNLTGSPGFVVAFASASMGGDVSCYSTTFSGAATGPRYSVTLNSVINTYSGGANFFPGSVAGTTATGGQYV